MKECNKVEYFDLLEIERLRKGKEPMKQYSVIVTKNGANRPVTVEAESKRKARKMLLKQGILFIFIVFVAILFSPVFLLVDILGHLYRWIRTKFYPDTMEYSDNYSDFY